MGKPTYKKCLIGLGVVLTLLMSGCNDESGEIDFLSTSGLLVLSTSPADGSTDVKENAETYIEFNRIIDMTSVSVNTTDDTCSGTIQLSSDEFQTCVKMADAADSSGDGNLVYLSPGEINSATTYKYKVIGGYSGVTSIDGDELERNYKSFIGFTTYSLNIPAFYAVEFDGNEYIATSGDRTLGFGSQFTIALWFKVYAVGAPKTLIHIKNTSNELNEIEVFIDGSHFLNIKVNDNGFTGTQFDNYRSNSMLTGGVNYFCAITMTAPQNYNFYINESDDGSVQINNLLGTLAGMNRAISIAAPVGIALGSGPPRFDGHIHAIAIWDKALAASEISEIYNNGALGFNLSINGADYISSDKLAHWWKLGEDPANIGKDYRGDVNMDANFNISPDDIITYPSTE